MIVFDLQCRAGGERFEAWFHSNADYDQQKAGGLVQCPYCQSADIEKAPMAPMVPKRGDGDHPLARLASMQAEMLKNSEWVGEQFADTARKMHSGEIEPKLVHGQATPAEARSLAEDGVPIAPLPLPVVPPSQVN
ncbi:MAG: DUF1178 family protein [Sphingomicrobium sp.]